MYKSVESSTTGTPLETRMVIMMAAVCGIGIANLYYLQPMLAQMSHSFGVDQIGFVATIGQIGYACGLLLIVPLGDHYNQRTLLILVMGAATVALVGMALAQTLVLLALASFAIGFTSIVPPLIIPFASKLAPVHTRGRTVGIVMSGLLLGMLLARVVSGYIGTYISWRAMYVFAAVLTLTLALTLHSVLPTDHEQKERIRYLHLLSSLFTIARSEPGLQEIIILGFLSFGALNAFWVILSFFLATPPYHYSGDIAGLFGLVGLVGVLGAFLIGKFNSWMNVRHVHGVAVALALCSFLFLWGAGQWMASFIVGVVLFDLGIQMSNICCQTRMSYLNSSARSRMNAAYSMCYYLGGSLGSFLGTLAWTIAKWNGVCLVACLMLATALGFHLLYGANRSE